MIRKPTIYQLTFLSFIMSNNVLILNLQEELTQVSKNIETNTSLPLVHEEGISHITLHDLPKIL